MLTLDSVKYRWTLTEYGQGDQQKRTIELPARDLIVGRDADADITIASKGVSKRHAKLSFSHEHLIIEDLDSTNGTLINGKRIRCSTVTVGDLVQFANALYRVGRRGDSIADGTIEEGILPWAQTLLLFERLINQREVVPYFQPIVTMSARDYVGYEVLARSELDGLTNPALMFGAAERLGQQAALSELLRDEGLQVFHRAGQPPTEIFLNTHPSEVVTERFINSLENLRSNFLTSAIVVEIHESAVVDLESMKRLRQVLNELDMKLSYDDFGAGQGRLLELSEVPPDVLKFDMQLIRDIDQANAARQELLASLVRIANELGTIPLAEGVETDAEHEVCVQMGFLLGQGYLYGRPAKLVGTIAR